jgi:hypothetical protein
MGKKASVAMQIMARALFSIFWVLAVIAPLRAWNATGHMTVAYIAYQYLDSATRRRVDTLLKRNPEYQRGSLVLLPVKKGLWHSLTRQFGTTASKARDVLVT